MTQDQNEFPEFADLFKGANHIDVKMVEGDVTLRSFIAGMISYQPMWVTFLYGVRAVFVRFLGMKQEELPQAVKIDPTRVPMLPGENLTFFKVELAKENKYWAAAADDKHLKAYLAIATRAQANGKTRFYVFTIVHYHNWAGPVYFNVIRPFHHVVVGRMTQAGVGAL